MSRCTRGDLGSPGGMVDTCSQRREMRYRGVVPAATQRTRSSCAVSPAREGATTAGLHPEVVKKRNEPFLPEVSLRLCLVPVWPTCGVFNSTEPKTVAKRILGGT